MPPDLARRQALWRFEAIGMGQAGDWQALFERGAMIERSPSMPWKLV